MKSKITKLFALLGVASLAITACNANALTFVDTITGSTAYAIGLPVVRGSEVGFASYPGSGNFTGMRPMFAVDSASNPVSVDSAGTSGVPISPAGGWVAQSFTPSKGGNITSVSLIAQNMHSVAPGYETEVADGSRSLTAFIVAADSAGNCTVTGVPAVTFSIPYGSAGVGTIVSSTNSALAPVTAGQKYFLVVGVGTPTSSWSGNSQYARLNWGLLGQNVDSSGATVAAVQQNMANASGKFTVVPGAVLGFTLTGGPASYAASGVGDAKNQPVGTALSISDVVITATGIEGVNCFYVEDANRASGIRVNGSPGSFTEGQHISISGIMSLGTWFKDGSNTTEKAIDITNGSISDNAGGNTPLGPLFATVKSIRGGAGVQGMTGLLVKATGKQMATGGSVDYPTFLSWSINDGSDTADLLCIGQMAWTVPSLGGNVDSATGVVSIDNTGTRFLLIRHPDGQ